MKIRVTVVLLLFFIGLSYSFRVTQGIDEAQRAVIKAYRAGAKEKAPYLYAKARSYKEIASILASEADDIGSKIFSIKTMNYASKAISFSLSGEKSGDEKLRDVKEVAFESVYTVDEYFPEDDEEIEKVRLKSTARYIGEGSLTALYEKLRYLQENKGRNCAPREVSRAEAFYDALLYELGKKNPNSALVLRFYNEANTQTRVALGKLKVAMENELECYTGVKKVVSLPPPPREEPEEKQPREQVPVEEPLKITARIHFDFDKYNIKREYIPILNEVARALKENDFLKVRIEGYTDIIGPKDYNEKLAMKRAKAVRDYLISKGVPEDKIEIVGFGKERFIASNEDSIGRLTNRRVEFIVIKVQEQKREE